MSKMKIKVNPEAINDIGKIKGYIRDELCNPKAADRIVNEIVKSYKGLKDFPLRGSALDSIISVKTDYRYLVCENYFIFYKVNADTVSVYRIIDARRDFIRILFKSDITVLNDYEENAPE